MLRHVMFLIFFKALALTGCYAEVSHEPTPPRVKVSGNDSKNRGEGAMPFECHFAEGRGCFDAFISSRKALTVAGRSFFNVEDFLARFSEVINEVIASGSDEQGEKDSIIVFSQPMDHGTFINGFEYELSGTTKRSGKLRSAGVLSLNNLTPGTYDLRLVRPISFMIQVKNSDLPPEAKGGIHSRSPAAGEGRCALVFSDTMVEIQGDQRTWETVSDFQLQILGKACEFSP